MSTHFKLNTWVGDDLFEFNFGQVWPWDTNLQTKVTGLSTWIYGWRCLESCELKFPSDYLLPGVPFTWVSLSIETNLEG